MAKNLIARYIWLVDTINRYGHLTLSEIQNLWLQSSLNEGKPLSRRTFFHYRDSVDEMFDIKIECNKSTYEYYIDSDTEDNQHLQEWLIDSISLSNTLGNASDVSSRILVENVPSAREHLSLIIAALKEGRLIRFSYKSYARIRLVDGIVLEPYFVKIFKQLWYVIGYNRKDLTIKTYALDRMSNLNLLQDTFEMPASFNPSEFFKDCFGIITNKNSAKRIRLKVSALQAKYFRALPLHQSQSEEVHDDYSIFSYRMRITYDLKEEILSHGSDVEVLEPAEFRTLIHHELKEALKAYEDDEQA